MKVGDKITVLGPNGVVTANVTGVEPMKTRAGWVVTTDEPIEHGYLLRADDEGCTWIYGDDEDQKAAMVTAEALWERTKRLDRRPAFGKKPLIDARRKKGTL